MDGNRRRGNAGVEALEGNRREGKAGVEEEGRVEEEGLDVWSIAWPVCLIDKFAL